jgi:hypothetical protein
MPREGLIALENRSVQRAGDLSSEAFEVNALAHALR